MHFIPARVMPATPAAAEGRGETVLAGACATRRLEPRH